MFKEISLYFNNIYDVTKMYIFEHLERFSKRLKYS